MKKYAWYFPNWHVDAINEKWHGKGWTEWEVVKVAHPRFEGHLQPKKPLWGYEDESDPKVFEKKIAYAKKYGVDGFIFDFYWLCDLGRYRINALEKGFLGARNADDCEFGVMWCNHNPIFAHPSPFFEGARTLANGANIDEKFWREVTDYCIENYFSRKNYIRIDGKVYFGIWNLGNMIKSFGSAEKFGEMIDDFRKRAREKGFEVDIEFCRNGIDGFWEDDREKVNSLIKKCGIDGVFCYDWKTHLGTEFPYLSYEKFREFNTAEYPTTTALFDVPLNITVSTGWDPSPRTVQSDMYLEEAGYPFSYITDGNTPEEIEKSFAAAKAFIDSGKCTSNYMTLSTWNEWTEGNYFEPDELYGEGYLEALKKVFG